VFNTVEALIAAAQIAPELHPWNCRAGDPEVPAGWSSTWTPRRT
jgi:bifunctional non-homologous end joining protein LigD